MSTNPLIGAFNGLQERQLLNGLRTGGGEATEEFKKLDGIKTDGQTDGEISTSDLRTASKKDDELGKFAKSLLGNKGVMDKLTDGGKKNITLDSVNNFEYSSTGNGDKGLAGPGLDETA